jgi:alpha-ketoglutarate-dependent taurine dioxygenase
MMAGGPIVVVNIDAYEVPAPGNFHNHAGNYQTLEVRPIASALGAEINGVDASAVSDEQATELAAALYRHKVIFLREQQLSHSDQENLTLRFGPFGVDAYTPGLPEHENVQRVVKEADDRVAMVFGGAWHTDSAFLECPPAISMLYCVDAPPYGGDTWFANTVLAHGFLSATMQQMLRPLKVHMSARNVLAGIQNKNRPEDSMNAVADALEHQQMMVRGSFHPLVRRHPETGEQSLYVDQTYSVGIEGMHHHEAAALINFLVQHATQPAFTCRIRWEPDMLVMWDNRSTVHHAFNDYDGFRREMFRTIVEGEQPSA